MTTTPLLLLPQPQQIIYHEGEVQLEDGKLIVIDVKPRYSLFIAQRLQQALAKIGLSWEIVAGSAAIPKDKIGVRLMQERSPAPLKYPRTSYKLNISSGGIEVITLNDRCNLWYSVLTLIQIIEQRGRLLPIIELIDHPDFPRRGVMLDISRDKVPTMETLYALIDQLASWKINEIQLYTEHTFAYQQHKLVWENASPMTGQQILELDQFCRERYIDLVPNQNSFGHMHRWLMHEPYRHLAEFPDGLNWPSMLTRRPFGLNPTDPDSIELLRGLYAELLAHFRSNYFNVGCDETFDLGMGRSKEQVQKEGKGPVYLEFLKKIAALVQDHGKQMMFWGDIIIQYPDLVPELPERVIALEWGYEADHPFDADGEQFAKAGVEFYVCPGTSSWMSLIGRTENAIGNLRNAAINGKKHGATGYLNTDWGDYGHPQPLPVSYLGLAYGAGVSWAIEANQDMDVPAVLNQFVFHDSSGIMGQLAYDLGNVYRLLAEYPSHNGAIAARALYSTLDRIRNEPWLPHTTEPIKIDPAKIRGSLEILEVLTRRLDDAQPSDPLVIEEYRVAVGLFRHGLKRLMIAYDPYPDAAKIGMRDTMIAEIRDLMVRYREIWLKRNRPGGLDDSLVRLERLLKEYEG